MKRRKIFKILIFFILFIMLLKFNFSIAYEPSEGFKEIMNSVSSSTSSSSYDINSYYKVYIEDNSALFHSYGCKELTGTPHKITLDIALDRGYYACEVCNPLGLAEESNNNVNIDKSDHFELSFVLTIIVTFVIALALIYKFRHTNFVEKLLSIALIICYILIPIASCLLHVYTVYLYAIDYGFWGASLSFCVPIISEILLVFDYIFTVGIFNNYLALIVGYLLLYVLLVGLHYLLEKD